MAQVEIGTTWNGAGLADRGPEFLRRGKNIALAVRDDRGAATNISPHNPDGSIHWSPATEDGKIRPDLFANKKVGGLYITNPDLNQGLWAVGAFKKGSGPGTKPSFKNNRFEIEQQTQAYDTDLEEENEPIMFTAVDSAAPWNQRLVRNLRLSDDAGNSLVEDPGLLNYGIGQVAGGFNPGRQIFVFRERRYGGLPIYSCDAVALAYLDDKGGKKWDRNDSEGQELTYLPTLNNYFMGVIDGEYQPLISYTWFWGKGWEALGGLPSLSSSAPTAAAPSAGTVTLAFPVATGGGDPFEYEGIQFSTDDGVTWSPVVAASNVAIAAGTVTVTATGVAAGNKKLRGVVRGSNGAVAYTPKSAQVTVA